MTAPSIPCRAQALTAGVAHPRGSVRVGLHASARALAQSICLGTACAGLLAVARAAASQLSPLAAHAHS